MSVTKWKAQACLRRIRGVVSRPVIVNSREVVEGDTYGSVLVCRGILLPQSPARRVHVVRVEQGRTIAESIAGKAESVSGIAESVAGVAKAVSAVPAAAASKVQALLV